MLIWVLSGGSENPNDEQAGHPNRKEPPTIERVILTADTALADEAYVDAILEEVFESTTVAASAIENDHWGELRCEVTVRRYIDPKIRRVRWAMLLESDECELRDYATKREALSSFRRFVQWCEAGGIAWDQVAIV